MRRRLCRALRSVQRLPLPSPFPPATWRLVRNRRQCRRQSRDPSQSGWRPKRDARHRRSTYRTSQSGRQRSDLSRRCSSRRRPHANRGTGSPSRTLNWRIAALKNAKKLRVCRSHGSVEALKAASSAWRSSTVIKSKSCPPCWRSLCNFSLVHLPHRCCLVQYSVAFDQSEVGDAYSTRLGESRSGLTASAFSQQPREDGTTPNIQV